MLPTNVLKRAGCQLLLAWGLFNSAAFAGDDNTRELYNLYCHSCHHVANSDAPQAFNTGHWKPRIEEGMDTLLQNAITGIGNMPPQGMCIECTQKDLLKLIEYMSAARQ